jgi:hypothetical protein
LVTVSCLVEGLTILAKCPLNTDIVSLHLSRALYNSLEGPTTFAECPLNYKLEIESPGYRLVLVESL